MQLFLDLHLQANLPVLIHYSLGGMQSPPQMKGLRGHDRMELVLPIPPNQKLPHNVNQKEFPHTEYL